MNFQFMSVCTETLNEISLCFDLSNDCPEIFVYCFVALAIESDRENMNYVENLLIYARNLSPFYIFSMVISICVVLLTAYFGFTGCSATLDRDEQPEKNENNHSSKSKANKQTDDAADEPDSELEEENERTRRLHIESLGQLKSAKLKSIEKSLTEEQRQAEKEIERAQLAAIFELLKKQADSSNINEDDLKEQLSLYR
ncbi:uncharacterized protein LOC121598791 [Anopheles merus]|uniref:uncharacterized protein LOC121598289 n=1 Tax=Anopheles merus TaxID=30066 RepID=UPI001BE44D4E|nr:uncharacterized protein LOC121598289 [Anopheles merus]XP_041782008.1 uncharacterized protein LOC121598791 [Anopheles merus]